MSSSRPLSCRPSPSSCHALPSSCRVVVPPVVVVVLPVALLPCCPCRHHVGRCHAAPCRRCAARRLVAQPPITAPPRVVVVPPVVLLPVAVVARCVAVVMPRCLTARHLRCAACHPADPCHRCVARCHRRVTLSPFCRLPSSCRPSLFCRLPSSCRPSLFCPLPLSCCPLPLSFRIAVSPIVVLQSLAYSKKYYCDVLMSLCGNIIDTAIYTYVGTQ